MPMGWELKVGEIKQSYVTNEEIWQALNNFYYRSQVTMSYKYGYFKSLIENLYNVNKNLELNYDALFYSFTKIYWNLVVHHNLWQSNNKNQPSIIQKILQNYCEEYSIPKEWTFDKLEASLQLEIIKKIKNKGKRYVIGAFYEDTNELFYEFDLKSEYLKFNPPVYKFLQKHQRILTFLINYHLAKFLERNNTVPNINYLLSKVEVISKRGSLYEFYEILSKYEDNLCFYCGKKLSKKNRQTHVDHFIPWSFIQTDNLWNLVLSCQKCNIQKKDKLADNEFLYNIIERNKKLIKTVEKEEKGYFNNYLDEKLVSLYEYSLFNGYVDFWKPN